MKSIKYLIGLSMLLFFACSNVNKHDPAIDNMLSELLESKNFFKLQAALDKGQHKLSEDRRLYYQMYCAQAFGKEQQSNEYADALLNKYKNQLHDTVLVEIWDIKSNNYVRTYRYKDASEGYEMLVKQYSHALDSAEIADYRNVQSLFGTLAQVKPQLICQQNSIEISSYRNQFNHLMIPVKCNGMANEFIFDTGANLSIITDSCAKKMGLKIYESDIKVGTSTNLTIQTKLAVADSLYVGDILFENVVFLVAPAADMSFPVINYEMHGLIGFPVIHQMGEIHLRKNGTIMVPKESQNRQLNNMYLEGLNPIVQLLSGNDTLLLAFDTGAKSTELSKKYYDKHKTDVEKNGIKKDTQQGGAGGVIDAEIYLLQNFPYHIGTKSNVLPEIPIMLTEYPFTKNFDGNLGQDIIMQFNELILNFQYMYIDFE